MNRFSAKRAAPWLAALYLMPLIALADTKLQTAIKGAHRSEANQARDDHRKPYEVLQFFGLKDDMTVIESWPAGGWYSEILAPYLKDKGRYIAASFDRNPETQRPFHGRINTDFDAKFLGDTATYGRIQVVALAPPHAVELAAPGSVDMVLDFRNAHNWIRQPQQLDGVPQAWYQALKPGGIVGLVDHRMDDDREYNPRNGYVHEEQIIEIMERNGFRFVARSDLLRNPNDKKDHPGGVWNLPPSLSGPAEDREKFVAIGESDRLVLKFVKE